jgi:hypothetical protein
MEVAVNDTIEPLAPSILIDEKIIAALKKSGPLTIEEMSSIPGMSWVRVASQGWSSVPGGLQPDYPVSASRVHADFYSDW